MKQDAGQLYNKLTGLIHAVHFSINQQKIFMTITEDESSPKKRMQQSLQSHSKQYLRGTQKQIKTICDQINTTFRIQTAYQIETIAEDKWVSMIEGFSTQIATLKRQHPQAENLLELYKKYSTSCTYYYHEEYSETAVNYLVKKLLKEGRTLPASSSSPLIQVKALPRKKAGNRAKYGLENSGKMDHSSSLTDRLSRSRSMDQSGSSSESDDSRSSGGLSRSWRKLTFMSSSRSASPTTSPKKTVIKSAPVIQDTKLKELRDYLKVRLSYKLVLAREFNIIESKKITGNAVILTNNNNAYFVINSHLALCKDEKPQFVEKINRQGLKDCKQETFEILKLTEKMSKPITKIVQQAVKKGGHPYHDDESVKEQFFLTLNEKQGFCIIRTSSKNAAFLYHLIRQEFLCQSEEECRLYIYRGIFSKPSEVTIPIYLINKMTTQLEKARQSDWIQDMPTP